MYCLKFTDNTQELSALRDLLRDIPVQEKSPVPPSWAERQAQSSERWNAARAVILKNILLSEHTDTYTCDTCLKNTAVLRCRNCLPRQFLCSTCDKEVHQHILHNREAMLEGFYRPLPPNITIQIASDGTYQMKEEGIYIYIYLLVMCLLDIKMQKSKLFTHPFLISGRYKLNLPALSCTKCLTSWTAGLDELVQSGYWPATINHQTIFDVDLFQSFHDLKQLAPGLSRQAFIGMLDERTKSFGRVS
ncbi:hypothetical protein AMEX_G26358 [Astyanax mexicanus]|uniref:CxC3 like cysteine cluster domain-containing protein n=1 Tax=Astyanax mexicanus TaxID=7994 RepID=A0A8T2KPS3_ASTMX|nr:hypothetical protein AMEX_G26358 [Astyanax mexicanus]